MSIAGAREKLRGVREKLRRARQNLRYGAMTGSPITDAMEMVDDALTELSGPCTEVPVSVEQRKRAKATVSP